MILSIILAYEMLIKIIFSWVRKIYETSAHGNRSMISFKQMANKLLNNNPTNISPNHSSNSREYLVQYGKESRYTTVSSKWHFRIKRLHGICAIEERSLHVSTAKSILDIIKANYHRWLLEFAEWEWICNNIAFKCFVWHK